VSICISSHPILSDSTKRMGFSSFLWNFLSDGLAQKHTAFYMKTANLHLPEGAKKDKNMYG
ncbi:MAG: hypothetical protein R6U10_05665, partial [Thermoplasmatota archaeon]